MCCSKPPLPPSSSSSDSPSGCATREAPGGPDRVAGQTVERRDGAVDEPQRLRARRPRVRGTPEARLFRRRAAIHGACGTGDQNNLPETSVGGVLSCPYPPIPPPHTTGRLLRRRHASSTPRVHPPDRLLVESAVAAALPPGLELPAWKNPMVCARTPFDARHDVKSSLLTLVGANEFESFTV